MRLVRVGCKLRFHGNEERVYPVWFTGYSIPSSSLAVMGALLALTSDRHDDKPGK